MEEKFKLYDIRPREIYEYIADVNDENDQAYIRNKKINKNNIFFDNKVNDYIDNEGYFNDEFYERSDSKEIIKSMYELFECYIHAKFCELSKNYDCVTVEKYVPEKNDLKGNEGYKEVAKNNKNNNEPLEDAYISGPIVPDIVLKYNDKYFIYDVKCKDSRGSGNSRDDRLQLLAYQVMYGAAEIGHIFPAQRDDAISAQKEYDIISKNAKVNLVSEKQVDYYQYDVNIGNIDATINVILTRLVGKN